MMRSPNTRRYMVAIAVSGLTGAASIPASVHATVPAPAPAVIQVIAQGIVEFGGTPIMWNVSEASLAAGAQDQIGVDATGFLHVTSGVLDMEVDAERVRLESGEAELLRRSDDAVVSASGSETVAWWQIVLAGAVVAGDGGFVGGPFTPGDTFRDVELSRVVVQPGTAVSLPDSEFPVLVLVTSGLVTAGGEGADDQSVPAGDPTTFDTVVSLSNPGPESASVVVAAVGPSIAISASATTTASPTTTIVTPSSAAAPVTTTASTTNVAPTTAAGDTDGDGLTDDEENNFTGTDPSNPDSDGDGLSDGEEVTGSGTDPNSADTDGDGLDDYPEIFSQNTDPFVADTDGDGADDGAEVTGGFDPLDPASHP